jgi:hypothetical protein
MCLVTSEHQSVEAHIEEIEASAKDVDQDLLRSGSWLCTVSVQDDF